jgi:hypothetical protein
MSISWSRGIRGSKLDTFVNSVNYNDNNNYYIVRVTHLTEEHIKYFNLYNANEKVEFIKRYMNFIKESNSFTLKLFKKILKLDPEVFYTLLVSDYKIIRDIAIEVLNDKK